METTPTSIMILGESEHKFAGSTEISYPWFLPLRFGVNYSTLQKDLIFSSGLGIYLGPFQIDAGFSDLGALFNNSKSLDMGVDVRLAF